MRFLVLLTVVAAGCSPRSPAPAALQTPAGPSVAPLTALPLASLLVTSFELEQEVPGGAYVEKFALRETSGQSAATIGDVSLSTPSGTTYGYSSAGCNLAPRVPAGGEWTSSVSLHPGCLGVSPRDIGDATGAVALSIAFVDEAGREGHVSAAARPKPFLQD